MFIELLQPRVIDMPSTRDRVKVRIGEPGTSGRFWICLSFLNDRELKDFVQQLIDQIENPPARISI